MKVITLKLDDKDAALLDEVVEELYRPHPQLEKDVAELAALRVCFLKGAARILEVMRQS